MPRVAGGRPRPRGGGAGGRRGRDSEARVAAVRALGMVKAAEKLVRLALGARLIERGWRPGQPVDEGSRRLQAAAPQLRAVAEALEALDGLDGPEPTDDG
jgi:DNA-binding transcriptional LysR family regulator